MGNGRRPCSRRSGTRTSSCARTTAGPALHRPPPAARRLVPAVHPAHATRDCRWPGRSCAWPRPTTTCRPSAADPASLADAGARRVLTAFRGNVARLRGAGIPARRRPRRASCTSSGRSRASRCRASRWSAATRTPRPTARSARSPSASARARSRTCSRRRRCGRSRPKTMRIRVDGRLRDGVHAKDVVLAIIAPDRRRRRRRPRHRVRRQRDRALSMEER